MIARASDFGDASLAVPTNAAAMTSTPQRGRNSRKAVSQPRP